MMTPRQAPTVRSARLRGRNHRFCPQLEELESRTLLSAAGVDLQGYHAVPFLDYATPQFSTTGAGMTPAQVRQAYGFNNIAFANGVAGTGKGQTIAIVTAFNDPTIMQDLHAFDQAFGINDPPNFTQISPYGSAGTSSNWSIETSLDVEWAHAMAPGANILLVQANSNGLGDLLNAVNFARNQPAVTVVSMSWGIPEFPAETYLDAYFTTPTGKVSPVTFVAASGDSGSSASSAWPSISTNVLAVGGTTLSVNSQGNYLGETAWSGSGGEVSTYESRPGYQSGFVSGSHRGAPDVAYDANPSTGFAIYTSASYNGQSGWMEIGGTSAGAPQWAALIAIADQGRALAGEASLGNVNSLIYSMPSADFHDITSGSNGAFSAGPGYDLVTGRGSPVANLVVSTFVGGSSTTLATMSFQATTNTVPSGGKPSLEEQNGNAGHGHSFRFSFRIGQSLHAQGESSDSSAQQLDLPAAALQSLAGTADLQSDGDGSTLERDLAFGAAAAEIHGTWRY